MVRAKEVTQELPVPDYSTIVLPLDGSTFAEQALDQARVLAASTGAKVVLVCVIPEKPDFVVVHGSHVLPVDCQDEACYLDYIADRLRSEGLSVETKLEYGVPADAILRVSEQLKAELIVMATHGRTGLERLRMGSVAMEVMQGAARPVLMVRSKERVAAVQPVRRLSNLTLQSCF
jgi:nucleotide-binding universal stress UspA family protein